MKRLLVLMVCITLVLSLVGCDANVPAQSTYQESAEANEKAVKDIMTKDKLPKITRSLERENIKRRIEFINQADRIGYLYLLSQNGQLIREVQVLGKVSSLNSYLTPMEDIKIIDSNGKLHSPNDFSSFTKTISSVITTQAADLDGTYGENQNGIFWFTPDGVYQEWCGLYFYSSERMTFTTKPLLIEKVGKN